MPVRWAEEGRVEETGTAHVGGKFQLYDPWDAWTVSQRTTTSGRTESSLHLSTPSPGLPRQASGGFLSCWKWQEEGKTNGVQLIERQIQISIDKYLFLFG